MEAWRRGLFSELVHESCRCARQSVTTFVGTSGDGHTLKVFTRLMLRDQVRAAVRWLTDRAPSKVLPAIPVNHTGKSVFDVVRDKHPDPSVPAEDAFIQCDTPPPSMDVDITNSHVELIARSVRGGAGPGGSTAIQWQDIFCCDIGPPVGSSVIV